MSAIRLLGSKYTDFKIKQVFQEEDDLDEDENEALDGEYAELKRSNDYFLMILDEEEEEFDRLAKELKEEPDRKQRRQKGGFVRSGESEDF